jgi:hypothetical protein
VDARLRDYLKTVVYGGASLFGFFRPPLLCDAALFLILLPFTALKDVQRQKQLKYGRRLKGPEMLTPRQFNRVVKGDGIGFKTDDMKPMLRIPARAEAQHMQIIVDTGAGKSALLAQVLRQVRSRGDSAIVYDPAREFVKRFYDPERGDVIVGQGIGLEMGRASSDYIQMYAGNAALLAESLEVVQHTSAVILGAITAQSAVSEAEEPVAEVA